MDTAKLKEEALALRREKHQMIKTGLNAAVECNHDLAIVYTPGVSAPCLAIKDDEDLSLELTCTRDSDRSMRSRSLWTPRIRRNSSTPSNCSKRTSPASTSKISLPRNAMTSKTN